MRVARAARAPVQRCALRTFAVVRYLNSTPAMKVVLTLVFAVALLLLVGTDVGRRRGAQLVVGGR